MRRKTGRLWDVLYRLLSGTNLARGVRPLTSQNHLLPAAGLPDKLVAEILEQVADGKLGWDEAKNTFVATKTRALLVQKIVAYLRVKCGVKMRDEEELRRHFPLIARDTFMNRWVHAMRGVKIDKAFKLPEALITELDGAVKNARAPRLSFSKKVCAVYVVNLLLGWCGASY